MPCQCRCCTFVLALQHLMGLCLEMAALRVLSQAVTEEG